MLTSLDAELFPDSCEVVEIPPHNQWVYLIQKNGSTSVRFQAQREGWTIYHNADIFILDSIDIYVRDARQRYISGVNTFLQHLKRSHPDLDQDTALWFVKRYSFLNRHYLPQFHWLINLARFTNPECVFRFRNFDDISSITDLNDRAGVLPPDSALVDQIMQGSNLELWFYLDQILSDLQGKSMTWWQLIDHYQTRHSEAYSIVTRLLQSQLNVLP
jgi:hypothetical protein